MAVVLAVAVGVMLSVQVFLNGRLLLIIGSAEVVSCATAIGGLLGCLTVGTATGALARARHQLALGFRLRWLWYGVPSLNGVAFTVVAAVAASRLGLALLTVAMVSGQTAGALAVDRAGLSTAGSRQVSPWRVAGVALAFGGTLVGVAGDSADVQVGLIVVIVAIGVVYAVQQASLSRIAKISGEPLAASVTNFVVTSAGSLILAWAVTGGSPPHGWSAPAAYWVVPGLLGVGITVGIVVSVRVVGVLRVMLAIIAGQSLGALLFDLLAPTEGRTVTIATVISLVLAVAAVAVSSGRSARDGVTEPPLAR